MRKHVIGPERRTHPFIWCIAIICTALTILVIFAGLVVFIGYLAIRPKVPYVSITQAHLDRFTNDQAGLLNVRLSITFEARNDNEKAHASFSDFHYNLSFHGIHVATLRNWDFTIGPNASVVFPFVVEADSIPLDPNLMAMVDSSLKKNRITFVLRGHTRTRWRVGPLGSVKFWFHLNCDLRFQVDGTSVDSHCTSKSK